VNYEGFLASNLSSLMPPAVTFANMIGAVAKGLAFKHVSLSFNPLNRLTGSLGALHKNRITVRPLSAVSCLTLPPVTWFPGLAKELGLKQVLLSSWFWQRALGGDHSRRLTFLVLSAASCRFLQIIGSLAKELGLEQVHLSSRFSQRAPLPGQPFPASNLS
jgi:hypothetical protein